MRRINRVCMEELKEVAILVSFVTEVLMCVEEFGIRYPGRDSDGSLASYTVHSLSLQQAINLDLPSFSHQIYLPFP